MLSNLPSHPSESDTVTMVTSRDRVFCIFHRAVPWQSTRTRVTHFHGYKYKQVISESLMNRPVLNKTLRCPRFLFVSQNSSDLSWKGPSAVAWIALEIQTQQRIAAGSSLHTHTHREKAGWPEWLVLGRALYYFSFIIHLSAMRRKIQSQSLYINLPSP